MASSPFPSYYSSGAISRAQYGMVSKLEPVEERSSDARKTCNQEIRRIAQDMALNRSDSQIAKDLLLLLQIINIRPSTKESISFSFIPAINLAEGGRDLPARRTGYLFLMEVLPLQHDLVLLLVNTIRKDLASSDEGYNVLALMAVIRFARKDLVDLFMPLLKKRLIAHESPMVRVRTSYAIQALESTLLAGDSPSSSTSTPSPAASATFSSILPRLVSETDPTVISSLLRRLEKAPEGAIPKDQIAEVLELVAESLEENVGQVHLSLMRVLSGLGSATTYPENGEAIEGEEGEPSLLQRQATLRLSKMVAAKDLSGWNGAYLNELVSLLPSRPGLRPALAGYLVSSAHILLTPSPLPLSSLSSPTPSCHRIKHSDGPAIPVNAHVLALRCLVSLDKTQWEDGLSGEEMGVVMGGVEHLDANIRLLTLGLLAKLDATLLRAHLERILHTMAEGGSDIDRLGDLGLEVIRVQRKMATETTETVSSILDLLSAVDAHGPNPPDPYWVDVVTGLLANDSRLEEGVNKKLSEELASQSPSVVLLRQKLGDQKIEELEKLDLEA